MWIARKAVKQRFVKDFLSLDRQVLLLRGARQVGKTSFVLSVFSELRDYPQVHINLLYPSSFRIDGVEYYGRDFFGTSSAGDELLGNIRKVVGETDDRPVLVFVDEADSAPHVLESIQTLASFSDSMKFVFTGSNLENLSVKNAATGRKKYFDLYPITFFEFVEASNQPEVLSYLRGLSFDGKDFSSLFHKRASTLFETYLRLGGMPKLVSLYLSSPTFESANIAHAVKDLAVSIEENVKTVLGDKAKLYEYEDVLRTLASLSANTLKYSKIQVQHAGRSEAKRLVSKTVGARVAHKVRLWESERDLSKYILFDTGILNYLFGGSHILDNIWSPQQRGIVYESFVGNALIAELVTRDDLFYWKSGNRAEAEFALRSPYFVGIDVKSTAGTSKSLNSMALAEEELFALVKIEQDVAPSYKPNHQAALSNAPGKRNIPLVRIPHFLVSRLPELLAGLQV